MWIEEFRVLVLVNQLHEDGKSNEYICKATGISETKCKEYITLGNKFKRVQGNLGFLFFIKGGFIMEFLIYIFGVVFGIIITSLFFSGGSGGEIYLDKNEDKIDVYVHIKKPQDLRDKTYVKFKIKKLTQK